MTSSIDPAATIAPVAPASVLTGGVGRGWLIAGRMRLGRRRLLVLLDVAAAAVVAATFAQLGPPELLFHVVFVILTAEAFLYGRRISFQRIAAVTVSLVAYAGLPALGLRVDSLELTEWPLMFTIAVLVAWMADREQSAARRYAGLYREARDRLVRAQEEERARIARDLHDGIGQTLTALSLTLDAASAGEGVPVAAQLVRARDLAREAIDETRLAAEQVRPPRLAERGLAAALRSLGSPAGAPVVVAVDVGAEGRLLSPDAELELFRIAQEAVRNALRHADARRIEVSLTAARSALVLEVVDDGSGFDPAAVDPRRLGLVGMAERADAAGGELRVSAAPGRGTRVRVAVPTAAIEAEGVG